MNRVPQVLILLAACIFLVGCGGHDEDDAVESQPAPGDHMFSDEQRLIESAKGMQDMLDQNAETKKQAIKDAN